MSAGEAVAVQTCPAFFHIGPQSKNRQVAILVRENPSGWGPRAPGEPSLWLHAQVAAEIRRAIADGEARPGERLPPAKDLAAVLGVNTSTLLRALRQLRDEGLLEFRRGRGITITGTPAQGAMVARVRELVDYGRTQGYRPDELVGMIESLAVAPPPPSTAPTSSL